MGEQGEGDVPVPGVVAADLVLVEPDLVLRGLEALLDRPPGAGDPDQVVVGGAGRAGAQVVGQLRLVARPRLSAVRIWRRTSSQRPQPGGVCSPADSEATAQSNIRGPFAPSAQLRALPRLLRGAGRRSSSRAAAGMPASRAAGWSGCGGRRRRSRSGAARTRCGTCSPARRPRPRPPRTRAPRRPGRGRACAGPARPWWRTRPRRGPPPPGSGPDPSVQDLGR